MIIITVKYKDMANDNDVRHNDDIKMILKIQ